MRNLRIKYQSPMYPNTTGTTQLIRKTLSQAVADAIREQILSGQLRMGTRLSQDALASSLGVSRIPLREALRQLEAEGFVVIYPHRGAFVVPLSLQEAKEVYEIRMALESLAVELAIPRLTESNLARIEAILAEMDKEAAPVRWLDLNFEFHRALYMPSDRLRLSNLIETWRRHSERYLRVYVAPRGRIKKAQEEHHEIADACRRRDSGTAVEALRRHLSHTLEGLMKVLPSVSRTNDLVGP